MVDNASINHISLGFSSRLNVFKVFDNLCDSEKNTNNKDIWTKPGSKTCVFDALEYLKSMSNSEQIFNDDNKKSSKKSRLKKLCVVKDSQNVRSITYFASTALTKSKQQLSNWTTKRKYSSIEKLEYPVTVETKQIKLEWSEESEIVFISPDSFYQACKSIKIERQKITIILYFKDSWHEVELQANHVRNITIYKNRPLIAFSLKPLLTSEIQHIADDIEIYASSPISLHPRKANAFKEVVIVFLKRPVTAQGIDMLQTLLSADKVNCNDSDIDTKEMLKNLFDALPQLVDTLLDARPLTWDALWGEFCVPPPPLPTVGTPKKISQPVAKSPREPSTAVVKQLPPGMTGLMLHPQLPGPSVNTISNGLPRPMVCPTTVPTGGFLTNHIVIATNRLATDPYPNLFNRMIHDQTATIGQLSVHVNSLAGAVTAPNSFSISFPTMFQGARPTHPGDTLTTVPGGVATLSCAQPAALAQAAMVPLDPNVPLHYVPGRHVGNIFESFNYAPSPDYNVLIHGSDLACLNPGQYLNDNIINFYLNYIRYELVTEQQRHCSHLFNVFFNTKLQGTSGSMTNESPETKHARVAKWTKKVDIFDKDFIFIPINEAQHWFLAVICFPWMAGMLSYDELFGITNTAGGGGAGGGGGANAAQSAASEIPENNSEFATVTRHKRAARLLEEHKVDPKPCILLFDSLQHQSRAPNVKLIREYLRTEWDAKRRAKDGPLVFDKNTIRGFNPQVPQQSNNIDCGIYVLHYVEKFFDEPLTKFTKEYFQSSLSQWFEKKKVDNKRAFIQNLLLKKGEAAQQHSDKQTQISATLKVVSRDDSGPDLQIL